MKNTPAGGAQPTTKRIVRPERDPAMETQRQEVEQVVRAISTADLVWTVPLFDDVYLAMQGQNIMLVDFYLRDLERSLLAELVRTENTPLDSAMFVSALSQMWVFATYELLRTWRQRVRDLKREAESPVPTASPETRDDTSSAASEYVRREQLSRIRRDESYAKVIEEVAARVEPVFRRIESLRMNLAKHEVPKRKGQPALAPGYGRIRYDDGSFYWMVDLGDNVVDMVSRRDLADELRRAVIGRDVKEEAEGD